MTKYALFLATLLGLSGCAADQVSIAGTTGTTVQATASFATSRPFATLLSPLGAGDVQRLDLQLITSVGLSPVGMPFSVDRSAVGGTFGGSVTVRFLTVPNGTYRLAVTPYDAGNTVISRSGGSYNSGGTATVNASAVPPVSGFLSVTLPLRDGTGEAVRTSVVVRGGGAVGSTEPEGSAVIGATAAVFVGANGTSAGYSGDGGPAAQARFGNARGMVSDAAGNFYFVDTTYHVIRRVGTDGIISTYAGNGMAGFAGDGGLASGAQFTSPAGLAIDAAGNLYVGDAGNHRIRKITPAGTVSTLAGSGNQGFSGDGGPAHAAEFGDCQGLACDPAGNVFFFDASNRRVWKVGTDGIIRVIGGGGTDNGDNIPATSALIDFVMGMAVGPTGDVYIADVYRVTVRKIAANGTITTVAGTPDVGGDDGDGGPAMAAHLSKPVGLAVDSTGTIYVADHIAAKLRIIAPGGTISSAPLSGHTFGDVNGVGMGLNGTVYVFDETTHQILAGN
ncbi:MAG: hypothetical protein H7338_22640 [Candidatus Sericytochromatia bacterium]|nr:hypothetical protein [Candidatus Sericytochromatia bacterium]